MRHDKREMTPQDARRDHRDMLRFLGLNAAFGMALGMAAASMIIGFDLGGIGSLVRHAPDPLLPALLIGFPMALVFGAAVTASGIWLMPYERKFAPERREEDDNQEDTDRQSR